MNKQEFRNYLERVERKLLDARFNRTVESDPYNWYEWKKETKYGTFFCDPDNDHTSKVIAIWGRFLDPEKAKQVSNNKYSGKRNILATNADLALSELDDLLNEL